MPQNLSANLLKSKKSILEEVLIFFGLSTVILSFFFISLIYGQVNDDSLSVKKAYIVVKNNAKIFSSDDSFNSQIVTNQIYTDGNVEVTGGENDNSTIVVTASSNIALKQLNVKEIEKPAKLKQQVEIQKKEYKPSYPEQKYSPVYQVRSSPESEFLFASNSLTKVFIGPTINKSQQVNDSISGSNNCVNHCLDLLQTQKINSYNSKSLGYCFLVVLSVRPPPILA